MPRHIDRRTFLAASTAVTLSGAPIVSAAQEASPSASPSANVELPDTPAGRQLAWVIGVLNGEEPMPEEDGIEARFSSDFLAAVPAKGMIQTFTQLQASMAPLSVVEIVEPSTPLLLNAVALASDGSLVSITITVEQDDPHLINGLLFAPHEDGEVEIPALSDWSELEAALATPNGSFGISASTWTGGEPEPVHQANSDDVFAIGSLFKLYVLGAVVEAIETGELSWDTEIELTEEALSLPSGITQTEPIGAMLTVETLATRMISISDNTATDMLLGAVGRDRVEAALETLGNSVPERNRPFLSTREMFLIKLGDEDRRAEFAAADEEERRSMLDEIGNEALPPMEDVVAWETPRNIDTIEWFATMPDLERAHIWLRDSWLRPGLEPLKGVMTASSGVPFDQEVWELVAFKGGSEPGAMALAWLLERKDGELFTYAVAVNDETELLDENSIAIAAGGAFALMAD